MARRSKKTSKPRHTSKAKATLASPEELLLAEIKTLRSNQVDLAKMLIDNFSKLANELASRIGAPLPSNPYQPHPNLSVYHYDPLAWQSASRIASRS